MINVKSVQKENYDSKLYLEHSISKEFFNIFKAENWAALQLSFQLVPRSKHTPTQL
jgi:hypothetical protein